MAIRKINPLGKSQEQVIYTDGKKAVRCYGKHNPHYYLSNTGRLEPIELNHTEDKILAIDECQLRERNIFSVGVRKSGNTDKFLGIRPDGNKNQQLEFTIEDINLDNTSSAKIDLTKTDKVDDITTDLGDILIRTTRQGCRQLVKASTATTDFRIRYTIHLTGLEIRNSKDGDYYEPDENGNFVITDEEDNFVYSIAKPKLLDAEFNVVSEETIHTLKDNADGTLEYIKSPDTECNVEAATYIDADVYYGETTDGVVEAIGATFNLTHAKTTANNVYTSNATDSVSVWNWYQVNNFWYIDRAFFMFDTDGVSGTTSCKLHIHGSTNAFSRSGVSVQQGTQADTLTTADFQEFSGTCFDYVPDGSWDQADYNTFTLNASGIAAINETGLTKLCVREYGHDYLDSAPSIASWQNHAMYFTDETGTVKDPYLEIIDSNTIDWRQRSVGFY